MQNELATGLNYLDYGARMYDSRIGRWHSIDPLAESFYSYGPYIFNLSNAINRIDVDGCYTDWIRNLETNEYEWMDDVKSREDTPEGYVYVGKREMTSLKI